MEPRESKAAKSLTAVSQTIAFNSMAIYARTFAGMLLALLGSRWTFVGLGQDDLGIYTVVAGLVGLLGILTGAMTQSAQRFLALGLGTGDSSASARYFNASLTIHLALSGISLLLGVTIGTWTIRHVLAIPAGRVEAALLAYQCVLSLAILSIATVPVSAVFAARQRFGLMSALETAPVLMNAAIAFTLRYVSGDRLTHYVLATTAVALVSICAQVYVALRVFPEVRPRRRYLQDWATIRAIVSFSGWNVTGIAASVLSRQGTSVLVNVFGGAGATAAYGLAGQATSQAATLTVGVIKATYPEVVSREGRGDRASSVRLALLATKYATFITLMWMLPFYAEVEDVLRIWLTGVPEHSEMFVRLLLLVILFDNLSIGYPIIVQSIGRVAAYQMSVGLLVMATFPISYFLLQRGAALTLVPAVVACVTFVQMLVRVAWGWRLAGMSPVVWAREVVGRAVASFAAPLAFLVVMQRADLSPWASVLLSTTGSLVLGTAGVIRCGLTVEERGFVIATAKKGLQALLRASPVGR